MNAQIRKALNRERSNVGRTAYADIIKNILKSCKSNDVLQPLVEDLQKRMYGNNKDETSWVDVATYSAKTLDKSDDVVFMTPCQRNNMTNQQVEILQNSGEKLIMVTDDVYEKIQESVSTFSDIYTEYNESFSYNFINYNDLLSKEKEVFDLNKNIFSLFSDKFKICKDIKISETIRVGKYGEETNGIYENNQIIIKRSILSDKIKFCGVLAHELCHHQHDYDDNSRDFENDLTDMLGYSVYHAIISNHSKRSNILKWLFPFLKLFP